MHTATLEAATQTNAVFIIIIMMFHTHLQSHRYNFKLNNQDSNVLVAFLLFMDSQMNSFVCKRSSANESSKIFVMIFYLSKR